MKFSEKLSIGYIRAKFRVLSVLSKRKAAEKAFELFCTPYPKVKLQYPPVFTDANHLSFHLFNQKINGFQWNYPQQKKVLILHGFRSASHKFHHFIQPLIGKGYEVLAFDALAHGSSGGNTVNAIEYAAMVNEIIRLYGPINSFIAHSFGGLAVCLALENVIHPHTTKVVLLAPATETTSALDSAFTMLKINDKNVRKEIDNIIFNISGKPTEWFSIRRAIKNIKASVLWFHDEEDDITPFRDVLEVKKDNNPNTEFVVTKGLGHRKIYRNIHVKKTLMEFL